MQGGYLAPMLMRTYGDGPIMGLKEGFVAIGEFVNIAGKHISDILLKRRCKRITISNNLHNEHN
jgi:hypothetical protein